MKRLLKRMLDETEFLSDFGIRAISKYHDRNAYAVSYTHLDVYKRQPTGACLGDVARLSNGSQTTRLQQGRPGISRKRISQTDAELHLVGQSQGHRLSLIHI